MLAIILTVSLLAPQSTNREARVWQVAKVVRAEQAKVLVPTSWNPNVTHRYTLETRSERIIATQLVPASAWRPGSRSGDQRQPHTVLKVGQEVRIDMEAPVPGSERKPKLCVLDSKGTSHILTVDEVVSKDRSGQ